MGGPTLRAVATAVVLLGILDVVFLATFPHFVRLRYNFSSAYIEREMRSQRAERPVIVLGDSVLWGYGVSPAEAAMTIVRTHRREWRNFAFAGGSAANSLAMLEALLDTGVRPRAVVFNVNEKTFNPEDSAYDRLHPALEETAWRSIPDDVRRHLVPTLSNSLDARIDRSISHAWHFYGMRADLRDAAFDEADAAHALETWIERLSGTRAAIDAAHRPTPDRFEGTYDLDPIGGTNDEYVALVRLASVLHERGVPAIAMLTPTNHALLHEYIDVPAYRSNLRTVTRGLEHLGVRVLDFDAAFASTEFLDNDHLTIAGNRRLAALIEARVGP